MTRLGDDTGTENFEDGDMLQPVSRLAKRTLDHRLGRVSRLLPRAAKRPDRVEHVHELRVEARRAASVLGMFAPFLPRAAGKRMVSRLKRIRRNAGPARDLDVIEQRMSRLAGSWGMTPQLAGAIDSVRRRRTKAQKPLTKAAKRARRRDFRRQIRDLTGSVRWRGAGAEPEMSVWAAAAIRPVLDRFVARSSVDLTDAKSVHQLRIAAKQVRYSLEVIGGAVGPSGDNARPVLRELHRRLGEVNDRSEAHALMVHWREISESAGLREVFSQLAAFERWSGSYAHDQFLAWWTPGRRLDLHQRLNAVLEEIGETDPLASAGDSETLSSLLPLI